MDGVFYFRLASHADHCLYSVQNGINLGVRHPVKDVPPISPVLDQPGLPQNGQLLGDVRLSKAEVSFHVADAVLAIPQDRQDRQPRRMGQHFERLRLGFEWLRNRGGMINHIQSFEYDISTQKWCKKGHLSHKVRDRWPNNHNL